MSLSGTDQNGTESSWRFRARTLRIDEPISVHYFNARLRRQLPELYNWLLSDEGQRPGQVQVVDLDGRLLKAEPWVEAPPKAVEIRVPKWRSLTTEVSPSVDSDVHLPVATESPFKRSQSARRSYIIDDSDHSWLQKSQISIRDFESIVTKLERLHFKLLQTERQANIVNGRVYVEIPHEEKVLPLETAIQSLQDHAWDHVDAIYTYWLRKRAILKKPLLEEFWNQFPWSVVLDRSLEKGPVRDCGSPETPFVRSSTEVQTPSMKISPQEQLRRMKLIREDLEVARTLADQTRKREKLEQKLDNVKLERMFDELQESVSVKTQTLLDCCQDEASPVKCPAKETQDSAEEISEIKSLSPKKKRKKSMMEEGLFVKKKASKRNKWKR